MWSGPFLFFTSVSCEQYETWKVGSGEHLGELSCFQTWRWFCPLNSIGNLSVTFQGGEPDLQTVGKMVLNDWQRGRIPFFVKPPNAEPLATPQVRTGWAHLLEIMAADLRVVSFDCFPLRIVFSC